MEKKKIWLVCKITTLCNKILPTPLTEGDVVLFLKNIDENFIQIKNKNVIQTFHKSYFKRLAK